MAIETGRGFSQIFNSLKGVIADRKKLATYTVGCAFALMAAIFNGFADVLPKPILDGNGTTFAGLNPIALVAIMYLANGLVFTGISAKKNPYKDVGRKNFIFLALIGVVEIIATATFYFGLKETSATNTTILSNSDIIFTWILAMFVFKEVLRRKEIIPYSLILVGAIMIPVWLDVAMNGYQLSGLVYGDFLIILAGLFYGIMMNLFRFVSDRVEPRRVLQIISFVGGGAALLTVFALQTPIDLRLEDMPTILISGVFGIGVSILFIVMAIKYIGTVRTMLIFSTQTLFGILFASFILGEKILIPHLVAFGVVFGGVYLLRARLVDK
jgi:drug/metabolite transporter (DMT)-like permease